MFFGYCDASIYGFTLPRAVRGDHKRFFFFLQGVTQAHSRSVMGWVLKIIDAEVMIDGEGFAQWSGRA